MPQKRSLTDRELKWLTTHFKNTKNDIIMLKLNMSHSMLHRLARELGLKKTPQFQRKCQANAAKMANEVNRRNNWPPKGYVIPRSHEFRFKKGESIAHKLGTKKNAERVRQAHQSRNRTIAAERRRILFGIDQKTKMKLVASTHAKISFRHVLKKRGYIVERAARTVFYDSNTNRSLVAEKTAFEKYRIAVCELNTNTTLIEA